MVDVLTGADEVKAIIISILIILKVLSENTEFLIKRI